MSMILSASGMHFQDLNRTIHTTSDTEIEINNCLGQRYIGSGLSGKTITINGVPGNALGAYMDGCTIIVNGNAQDATGDTMNDGKIIIHGSAGDACGYAMRGGEIFVQGNVGYRAGIHMKAYQDKVPVMVIGGTAGSFLGEYQAGGLIVVLGIGSEGQQIVNNFCGTGMHGGRIFLRCPQLPPNLPPQIMAQKAGDEDLETIRPYVEQFTEYFGGNAGRLLTENFWLLTPNSKNPYRQLYTHC